MCEARGKVFTHSGFKRAIRHEGDSIAHLAKLIIDLGGGFMECESLPSSCTHLICAHVSRTEKYLSASAKGLWILCPEYVLDSYKNGKWLSEEPYEWNGQRLHPFYNPRICDLIGYSPKRNRTLVAETKMGRFSKWTCYIELRCKNDQKVYERILKAGGAQICDLETLMLSSDTLQDVYKFTELTHAAEIRCFHQGGLFLSIDYIRNYLLREAEPSAFDFRLGMYTTHEDPLLEMKNRLSDPILCGPRLDLTVKKMRTDSACPVKMKKKRGRKKKETGKEMTALPDSTSTYGGRHKLSTPEKRARRLMSEWSSSPLVELKKKELWGTQHRMEVSKYEGEEPVTMKELPVPLVNMFDYSMDENAPEIAVGFLVTVLSPAFYPPPKIVAVLISFLLAAEKNHLQDQVFGALDVITRMHPPTTKELSQMYLEAISCENNMRVQPWLLFSKVIRLCISGCQNKIHLLLNMLVQVIQADFIAFLGGTVDPKRDIMEKGKCPLVVNLFWPDGKVGSVSKNCQDIFLFLSQLLKDDQNYGQLLNVQQLLSLVVECVRLSNVSSPRQREESITSDNCYKFAVELIKACQVIFKDTKLKKKFLCNMEPFWFQMILAQILLQNLPNIGYKSSCNQPLSLNKIIYHYMKPEAVRSPRKSSYKLFSGPLMHIPELQKAAQSKKNRSSVNYINRKGESPVHLACMDNNVPHLRKLMSHPGVNIDMKDYAGWTPLHEAASLGHTECVKMLLEWKPHPSFRTPEDEHKLCFVDLVATSKDNLTTPLHDAVCNNQVDAARLLLQYGGPALLEKKDKKGKMPADMVTSPEMARLLSSPHNIPEPVQEASDNVYEDFSSSQEEAEKDSSVKISLEHCHEYIDYLGCLIESYLKWNCLRELNAGIGTSDITLALTAKLYHGLFGSLPANNADIVRLCNDLKLLGELSHHLQMLEGMLEKKTGKNKKEFHVQFFTLETKASSWSL